MRHLRSLRLRLLAFAAGIIVIALVITGIGVAALFERYVERRVTQELDVYLAQLAGGIRFDATTTPSLARHPSDPRFNRVFGGLYWQISEVDKDVVLRSRSLWDSELPLPDDALLPGQIHSHILAGPAGKTVLVREQSVIVPTMQGDLQMHIAAAIDTEELQDLTKGFTGDLLPALVILGFVLLVGFSVQVSAGLRPMQTLRRDIADIRTGRDKRLRGPVPSEVEPLVDEVNALLDLQDQNIIRARDRAADLAHGLKTPLTALATDVARLRAKGEHDLASDIEELATRMRRHLDRELVRARQRHGQPTSSVALQPAIISLVRTLERTPHGANISIGQTVPPEIRVAMESDNLHDVFGNLLENACRHAKSRVQVDAAVKNTRAIVTVDDDGPGLDRHQIAMVTQRGQRLDTAGSGAGLGLAIVSEIIETNDGFLAFEESPLGGLRVVCDLPLGRPPSIAETARD